MELTFDSYIYKVHKQVHPHMSISQEAKTKLSAMINALIRDFVEYIITFTDHSRQRTISIRDVQSAVRVVVRGELRTHAVSEGVKAVTRYTSAHHPPPNKRMSAADKAGLKIPPARVRSILKANVVYYKNNVRISETSSVYLAAVVEYLLAEILELSGNAAMQHNRTKTTVDDIKTAIKTDVELDKTLHCVLQKHDDSF